MHVVQTSGRGPDFPARHRVSFSARFKFSFCLTALCLLLARSASAIIDSTLQMQLGNPSGATTNAAIGTNYLVLRPVESLSYNTNTGQPNWASWDLTKTDVGPAPRSGSFFPDTNLPAAYYRVTDNDYIGVGAISFNRGHMCPSEDRTDTTNDNNMVFLMSNIIPQSGPANQGPWGNLEQDCRDLCSNFNDEILIICGPSGFNTNAIPSGKALIPTNTWKVCVVVPPGAGTALSRISVTNRVIAIEIPNVTNGIVSTWASYITTARQIELDSGYTFFTTLPGPIASAFRARIDGLTSAPAPTISSFSPNTGDTNTTVTITGTNFKSASAVMFHGTSSTYYVNSSTQIVATVPAGATSGTLSVTTVGGTGTSAGTFTVSSTSAGGPDLAAALAHSGNFAQGDIGDTYTLTVDNVGGTSSTGTVSVTNILPAGLTATAISGSGWTTTLANLTASRSDSLSSGSSFPALTITVNVATNAAASLTNTVTLGGGGDTNAVNNTATDATTVLPASIPTVTTGAATNLGVSSATLNATVNPNNQPATVWFEYGTSTSYGSTGTVSGTFTGSTVQAASSSITGLTSGTLYHFRAVASNAIGTTNTPDVVFTTPTGSVSNFTGTLMGWDVSTVSNFGVSPFAPTINSANLTITGLTRGSGVNAPGGAAAHGWGGTGFASNTPATAVAAGEFITFGAAAGSNTTVSYTSISRFDYRRSNTGATNGVVQYQLGAGAFTDITNLIYSPGSGGSSALPIDLSGISALQNVGAGVPVTFRIVNYMGTSGGTWYIFDVVGSTAPDLAVQGTVSVTTTSPSHTSHVIALTPLGTGTNRIDFSGVASTTYVVQSTTNLTGSWSDLSTNTSDTNGLWFIIDTHATNSLGFYRSVFR